ncbi:MAG TPA: RIO1 family regulatory kinase/ATPase [Intrasporangium sp.]|uniref:serine protein kinase RIO n=1 Tax=Intrasporangium sp. TaxID=1925024 RepID=UPI002D78943D|nr:RIO1 family regulatory kinase/ATPase [Intrasporangium sp.]HET7399585.1 RIO1 family regulatory kinase/ATPase [Intrasporangium sp.]
MSRNAFPEHDASLTFAVDSHPDAPPEGERWSTWDGATHGPRPRPDWVITELGAVEADLGILKTGKEADVHLVRRWLPGDPSRDTLLAAKRYRSGEHRLFHRDAGYLEGRRVRKSREMRAMRTRTEFGKQLISGMWAFAEFGTLADLWERGLPVPYPVQLTESEMLMEFIGTPDGVAAPRLVQSRPTADLLPELFEQLRAAMLTLAELGWAHGDLSPYNVLLDGTRLVLIDWPQVVDVIGNPHGPEFLERDTHHMCEWFTRRGYAVDEGELFGDLIAAATSRW